ncbi:O-antigen ligase family protein [Candidatus Daviesbacteria bacterium]|nr:O-antigen ligase family protein [Candidatus Daviesbacteria bacterium]
MPKEVLNVYLGWIFKIGLAAVILSALFLFTNLTTDFYDTPKFLVLLTFTGLLFVLSSLRYTLEGKVAFTRTPLDLPLILLIVIAVISTFSSASPFVSVLGNQAKPYPGLVSIITLAIFYLVVVNNLKGVRNVRQLIYLLLGAGAILSVATLLSYAGVKLLPTPWQHGTNFTPTGSSFSTASVLALLLPLVLFDILGKSNIVSKTIGAVLLTLFGITIALTGSGLSENTSWTAVIGALAGVGLSWIYTKPKLTDKTLAFLFAPLGIIALVVMLSFIPPVGNTRNPLYDFAKNFPREVQLPIEASWKVSVSAFRDSPFWGSGPATYLFDFTNYKPIEFNNTKLWNLRFDSSFNEYLNVLATLGGVGLVALLFLTVLYLSSAFKTIQENQSSYEQTPTSRVSTALAVSGIVFFVILALHASSLVLWIIGLTILAGFMALNTHKESLPAWAKQDNLKALFARVANTITPNTSTSELINVDALPSILLIVALGLVGFVTFFGVKLTLADYHHRQALEAVAKNDGIKAYNELVVAEGLNPYSDLYRTDIAQTNFALANAIASAKGPTQENPQGSLTDQDRQNIQTLLQQSINEGKQAIALSPKSAVNWEILATIYRQIAGVAQNALLFSLDSYGRAIQNDPLNPQLRLNVGGVYYAAQNYDLAIRFFTDSINLKPDFANGYYNLSVALREKGDLNTAIQAAERTLQLITDKESQDFKTAEAFLNDLKTKAEQDTSTQQPPAAQAEGALKNEGLPKVLDLPKPDKIATPPAVKKPNSTPEPSAAP